MTVIDYHSYQEGMASIRTIGTSVEYGFFYLIELLKSISKKLKQRIGVVDTVAGKRKREEDGGKKENNLRQLINIFHRCQESLELSVIWNREDENSGDNVFPVNKNYQLDKLNLFALRTLGSLVLSNTINDIHEKAIVSELLDVLKSKSFDKIHIQRIHDAVFR